MADLNDVTPEVTPQVTQQDVEVAVQNVEKQVEPVAREAATVEAKKLVAEATGSVVGQRIVKFFDSAVGKSFKTLLWTAGAYGVTVFGAWVANIHLDARLISLGVPGLLNWLVYTLTVFTSGNVQNLPTKKV